MGRDDETKALIEENAVLKRRNGLLLIENESMKKQVSDAKKDVQKNQAANKEIKSNVKTQSQYLEEIKRGPVRPQTAHIGAFSKLDGFNVS